MNKDKRNEWICKICGRKIGVISQILRLWYQIDEGKVHRRCYNKPRKKVKNSELKFA